MARFRLELGSSSIVAPPSLFLQIKTLTHASRVQNSQSLNSRRLRSKIVASICYLRSTKDRMLLLEQLDVSVDAHS